MNAEFRNYFSRIKGATVPANEPEQDTPPANKTAVDNEGNIVNTVFVEGGYPSETMFKKLFNSIVFKLNPSDRAKDSADPSQKSPTGDIYGGHVTVSTNEQAKSYSNGDLNKETRVPRVSQLPAVNSSETIDYTHVNVMDIEKAPLENINITIDATVTERNLFRVMFSNKLLLYLNDAFIKTKNYIDSSINNAINSKSQVISNISLSSGSNSITHTLNSTNLIIFLYDSTNTELSFEKQIVNNTTIRINVPAPLNYTNCKLVILKA